MASATVGILRVLLSANTAEFQTAMEQASNSVKGWQKTFSTLGQQATAAGSILTSAFTVPLTALGVGATKAAMDFETAFANVSKTVDGVSDSAGKLTPKGEELAQAFRNLAKEIPATTQELSAIAAIGGQMDVPIDQMAEFTRHVAALGVAVDGISTEEAAMGLANIGNIAGTGTTQIAEMASALVHLGNNSAATEAQILEFTKRLMGAGDSVGMTVPQVMALGTQMASLGINAEAGGTAMSTVINKISVAVSEGGSKLTEFARVAGVSAEQFAEMWKRSPIEAIQLFITGLGTMKERGVDLNLTMGELGTEGIRVADTLKRMAGDSEGLGRSLAIANEGFAAGNAHLTEAEKKYATTANQIAVLWNRIKDIGITLGQAFLPLMTAAVGVVERLLPVVDLAAKAFAAMPAPIQAVVAGLGLLLAAVGPVLVAFGLFMSAMAPLVPLMGVAIPAAVAAAGSALAALALPIAAVVAAVGTLTLVWMKWGEDIKRIAQETYTAVKTWLVDNWQGSIFQKFAQMLQAMNELFDALRLKLIEKAQQIFTGVKSWILDKLQPIFEAVKPLVNLVVQAFTVAKDSIINTVTALYNGVKTWLVDKFTSIVDSIKAKIDAVTGFFKDMKDKVVGNSYVPEMVALIGQSIALLQGNMVQPVGEFTSDVKAMFEDMRNGVNNTLDKLVDKSRNSFEQQAEEAKGKSEEIPSYWETTVAPRLMQAYEQISRSLSDNLARMLTGAMGFADGFKSIWESIKQSLLGVFADILKSWIDGFLKNMLASALGFSNQTMSGMGSTMVAGSHGIIGQMSSIFHNGFSGILSGLTSLFSGWLGWAMAGIGALLAFGSSIINHFRGGEEGTQVNPARDQFLAQFGGSGTGPGSGFYELGAQLEAAVGSAQAEALHAALRQADTMAEFNAAIANINAALGGGGGYTAPSTTTSSGVIDTGSVQILPDWVMQEAPEEEMGALEAAARGMAAGGMGEVTRPTLFLAGEEGREKYWFGGANDSFANAMGKMVFLVAPRDADADHIMDLVAAEFPNDVRLNRRGQVATRLRAALEMA